MSTWESEMTKEEWQAAIDSRQVQQSYTHTYIEGERIEKPLDSSAPLTEQEYVYKSGYVCPNCHKTEGVDAWDRAEVHEGVAWQNISCSLCCGLEYRMVSQ